MELWFSTKHRIINFKENLLLTPAPLFNRRKLRAKNHTLFWKFSDNRQNDFLSLAFYNLLKSSQQNPLRWMKTVKKKGKNPLFAWGKIIFNSKSQSGCIFIWTFEFIWTWVAKGTILWSKSQGLGTEIGYQKVWGYFLGFSSTLQRNGGSKGL